LVGDVSAKAAIRPRAISSSWLCMVTVTPSRSWTMPAMRPDAVLLPPEARSTGTPSMNTFPPVVPGA
jgi:hypothetical protein